MCEESMTEVIGGDALRELSPDVTCMQAKDFTDADLAAVGEQTTIERLDLGGCPEITDAGVSTAAAWPRFPHFANCTFRRAGCSLRSGSRDSPPSPRSGSSTSTTRRRSRTSGWTHSRDSRISPCSD
jgi:hypothetical protein